MVNKSINKKRGVWNFGGNVAPNFVDHILKICSILSKRS